MTGDQCKVILDNEVSVLVDKFLTFESNKSLIFNFLLRVQDDLFLSRYNVVAIQHRLVERHHKVLKHFNVDSETRNFYKSQVDLKVLDSFFRDYFDKLSLLLKNKLNLASNLWSDFVAYSVLERCWQQFYYSKAQADFQNILQDATSTIEAIQILILNGLHDCQNPKVQGLLTHYLLGRGMFDETGTSYLEFVRCSLDLHDLIEVEITRKSISDFETMLSSGVVAKEVTMQDIDLMSGYEFEKLVARIFSKMGYSTEITSKSGDQGIDIIARKGKEKIGIQTKCYSGKVANSAIQEVVAGTKYYDCSKSMVITNSYFTKSAIHLGCSNNVILWDRRVLDSKLKDTLTKRDRPEGLAYLESLCVERMKKRIAISDTDPPVGCDAYDQAVSLAVGYASNGSGESMVNDLGQFLENKGVDCLHLCNVLVEGYAKTVEDLIRSDSISKADLDNLYVYVLNGIIPFEEYVEFHYATERLSRLVAGSLIQ